MFYHLKIIIVEQVALVWSMDETLAKNVLMPLRLTAVASATGPAIH